MVHQTPRSEEEQITLRGKIAELVAARQTYGELPLPSALNGIAYQFLEQAISAEWEQSGRPPLQFGKGIAHPIRVCIVIPGREEPVEMTMYLDEPAHGNMLFTSTRVVEAWYFYRKTWGLCTFWVSSSKENKYRILCWSKDPKRLFRAKSYMAPSFINVWYDYLPYIPILKLMKA